MPRRYYSSTALETTLNGGVNSSTTTLVVSATTGFPGSFPYTLVVEPDTVNEELVTVTAAASTTLTVTRGVDGTAAVAHVSGVPVRHSTSARDFDEPNAHVNASSAVHGLAGSVVGTTDTQTLTNKTLTTPTVASFTNAGHSHLDAAGGGLITVAAISDIASVIPAGIVVPFAGSTAPSQWLLCDGSAVSRTTYASLFTAIGTTYGIGNGSTTFNVPDLRGRVPAGLDNMGGTDAGRLDWANTAGTTGGAQTHTLSTAEMPAHTHASGTLKGATAQGGAGSVVSNALAPNTTGAFDQSISGSTASTGGGGAHNNMQPTMLMNYIIRAA